MTDRHTITIRCEHVTRTHTGGGKLVAPPIAAAQYTLSSDGTDPDTGDSIEVEPHDVWAYSARRGGSITDPPSRRLPPKERGLRNATAMQTPRSHYQPNGPDERRVAIACLGCHQRVVAVARKLDALMNRARLAGIDVLTLSQIRANL